MLKGINFMKDGTVLNNMIQPSFKIILPLFPFPVRKECLFLCVILIQTARSQVNTERYRIAADSTGFSLSTDIDMTFMSGNTDFLFAGAENNMNYRWKFQRLMLVAKSGIGKSDGESFLSQSLVHLRDVHTMTNRIALELFIQYNNDKKRRLRHRTLAGGGIRLTLADQTRIIVHTGLSVFAEHEVYKPGTETTNRDQSEMNRLSAYITGTFKWTDHITFQSVNYYQPGIGHIDDLKLLSDNAIYFKAGKRINWVTKLNLFHDSRPAAAIDKTDIAVKMGIAIDFNS